MAAVFALIFLFVLASIGLMFKTLPDAMGFGSYLMMACFAFLAGGLFLGLFRLARQWENEEPSGE